jgi:hypothetical protein
MVLTWGSMAAACGAAAAAAIVFVIVDRPPSESTAPPSTPAAATSTPATGPATGPARVLPPPVILTARLEGVGGRSATGFRGAAADSRLPKSEGLVVSVDDGEATIDLGSVDGLEKGSVVDLFRGRGDANAAGSLTVARVFRERATGRAARAGSLQVGDRAALAPAVHVSALLDQVEARIASGDTQAALALAGRALSSAQSLGVPADLQRRALAQLGTLEHRSGATGAAERHLRSAVDALDTAPAAEDAESAAVLNELGALFIERGRYAEADAVLRRAQPRAAGAVGVYVTNNLAALAAIRGDLGTAESEYRAALTRAGNAPDLEPDRRAIQKNLDALRAPR